MIDFDKDLKTFEIVVSQRDSKGEPTDKRVSYASDSSYKIWEFYAKQIGAYRHRNKSTTVPDAKEAEKILKALYGED
jgi:hypothetical protein